MRIIKIKNLQLIEDTYLGQTILPGEYYELSAEEFNQFAEDEKVNSHLWSDPAKISVNNGIEDLSSIIGDQWLKGNHTTEVNTIGELSLSWDDLKNFYNANSNVFMNYVEFSSFYYIWLTFRDHKLYIPSLLKETDSCTEFEADFKSKCNVPEAVKMRISNCKIGRALHDRYVSFRTSSGSDEDKLDNTDWKDNPYGDVVYVMKDEEGNVTTDNTLCKETWIFWEPTYDYEIEGGKIDVPETLSGEENLWEVHVVAAPNVPEAMGGEVQLISNPRIKWKKGSSIGVDASMNPKEMLYSPYHTNQLLFLVKHPIGAKSEFQINIKIFK